MAKNSYIISHLITHLVSALPFIIEDEGGIALMVSAPNYEREDEVQSWFEALGLGNDIYYASNFHVDGEIKFGQFLDNGSKAEMLPQIESMVRNIFQIMIALPLRPLLVFAFQPEAIKRTHLAKFDFLPLKASIDAYGDESFMPRKISEAHLPLAGGDARLQLYGGEPGFAASAAMLIGEPEKSDAPILLRLHSQCFTGDIFSSRRCDCGHQLESALQMIYNQGAGLILYLPQEGRGIGLHAKLHAYQLQDEQNIDTVDANLALGFPADKRDFSFAIAILTQLGITKVRLMSHNPRKRDALLAGGIMVEEMISLPGAENVHNCAYLKTKRDRLGHHFSK